VNDLGFQERAERLLRDVMTLRHLPTRFASQDGSGFAYGETWVQMSEHFEDGDGFSRGGFCIIPASEATVADDGASPDPRDGRGPR